MILQFSRSCGPNAKYRSDSSTKIWINPQGVASLRWHLHAPEMLTEILMIGGEKHIVLGDPEDIASHLFGSNHKDIPGIDRFWKEEP